MKGFQIRSDLKFSRDSKYQSDVLAQVRKQAELKFKRKSIIEKRLHRIKKLWIKRDKYEQFSRRWIRIDRRLQRRIHKCSKRMEKYGMFSAGWWVLLRASILEEQQ